MGFSRSALPTSSRILPSRFSAGKAQSIKTIGTSNAKWNNEKNQQAKGVVLFVFVAVQTTM
jgi:hypothetical protein